MKKQPEVGSKFLKSISDKYLPNEDNLGFINGVDQA